MNWEVIWYVLMLTALFVIPIASAYALYWLCFKLPKDLEEDAKDDNLGV